ncbi:Phage-related protein, tail component [Brevibacterium iodinum ATCC 49514]|uniref:Phage-related protein, tail component n=1 Tax=Brevibacterium iodinum ATCC 49514 TaxID=1255616 RepID=A0A2H1KI48_9MICO|nr:DUF6270 domain-containing protein [Brevibacterium iodinum]SMX98892.1 Phage-related protein, tail component [Brevibacterium iodinum ATCC 49514]SUW14460.1 Uncharacterised protein [Brevibacterium iodinum]
MRRLLDSRWGNFYEWSGIDEFLKATCIPDGVHRIKLGIHAGRMQALQIMVRLRPGRALTVHFYGAQTRRGRSDTPIFRSLRTSASLNASFVLVHDPSLDLDDELGIAWYEGYDGFAAATVIRAVLSHLSTFTAAPRTILWGGSAGGYAALRHVGSIPGAVAFVWNPQTSIPRYLKAPVRRYATTAFGSPELPPPDSISGDFVFDLTEQPRPNWTDAPVVYLQEADDRHVREHLAHLIAILDPQMANEVTLRDTMFGHITSNFYLHLSHWMPGHTPPPKAAVKEFLNLLVDTRLTLEETLAHLENASRLMIQMTAQTGRTPSCFELVAPVRQPPQNLRAIQWGSRLGRESVSEMGAHVPVTVSRSILGQSVIAAFRMRAKPEPRTYLRLKDVRNPQHRRSILDDRRASARAALLADPTVDVVIIDFLEEVRGITYAGAGLTLTEHRKLTRADGQEVTHFAFGSAKHITLWRKRLKRMHAELAANNARLVILDMNVSSLNSSDWEWLGLNTPPREVINAWHTVMEEARSALPEAVWIPAEATNQPLPDRTKGIGRRIAVELLELNIKPRNCTNATFVPNDERTSL